MTVLNILHQFCISVYILSNRSDVYGFSGEGDGTPLQYFSLENPMDGGASQATVHGIAKSRT